MAQEWNFKDYDDLSKSQKIHSYPATFPPRLARRIIQDYSNKGDLILDIFSGSGTTLVESNLADRNSIGIELNPLAIMISQVKTTPINFDIAHKELEKLGKAHRKIKTYPITDEIRYWFETITYRSLKNLKEEIENIEDKRVKDFFLLSLSDIVRKASKLNHLGFKMHKRKDKSSKYNYSQLLDQLYLPRLKKNLDRFKDINSKLHVNKKPKIIHGDSRELHDIKECTVDLILTSPPYGDSRTTVAYGEFSRLPLDILDLHSSHSRSLDGKLLGGSRKDVFLGDDLGLDSIKQIIKVFNRKISYEEQKKPKQRIQRRLKDVISFYKDLQITLRNASRYLKVNGIIVIIISTREVMGVKLDSVKILKEMLMKLGVYFEKAYERDILKKTMPSIVNASNIPNINSKTMSKEQILIFKKRNK